MSLNRLGLGFVFTARDLASRTMTGVERRFASLDARVTTGAGRMTKAFRRVGAGIGTFTAGAAGALGGLALADAAGELEQGLAAVGAITQATSGDLDMLHDAAIGAGIATQFSPDEAVAGLQALATAGQNARQSTRTLIPVLDLAAGSLGQLGVAQAADAVVGTLNAYSMSADHAGDVTDKLLRITQLSNFQTRDFEAGLAKAASTGAFYDQSLNDTLITLGLLRNANIDASSSGTAFREAVRRLGADATVQARVQQHQVDVFDQSTGQMRSVIDIMTELSSATEHLSGKERKALGQRIFGTRGLTAYQSVANATYTAMVNGTEVVYRGAAALAKLREKMDRSAGTAATFREALLDTFKGQKTLLKGTLQTMAVVFGEPFAKVLKPVVRLLVDVLNAIIRAWQTIPAPVKKVVAGVVVAAGSFLMLVGAVIALKGALVLAGIAMGALGVSFGGIVAMVLPAIVLVGVLGAAVTGFYLAVKKNLGGIADFFRTTAERITLLFRGMTQLFSQGGFSGAVREELARAENQGLKRFLISVWMIVHRIRQVWDGFKEGFVATIEAARPVFDDLREAFGDLGHEITLLFRGAAEGASSLPSSEFRSFGQIAGGAIATVVKWLAKLIAIHVRVVSGVVAGFRSMTKYIGPAFRVVGDALNTLIDAFNALLGRTKDSTAAVDESTSGWKKLGYFLGQVFGAIVTALAYSIAALIKVITVAIHIVNALKVAVVSTGQWIGVVAAKIYLWFTETLPNALATGFDAVMSFFVAIGQFFSRIGRWFVKLFDTIAEGIKAFLRPVVEFFKNVGRAIKKVFDEIRDFVIRFLRIIPDIFLPSSLEKLKRAKLSTEVKTTDDFAEVGTQASAAQASASTSAMPAVAAQQGRVDEFALMEARMMAFAREQARRRGQPPPLQINVQVDGETIANAVHDANTDSAVRSQTPLPTY